MSEPSTYNLPAVANVLVLGTGAIGGVYSSILCRAGASVTCVCRSNYNSIKSQGIRLSSTIFGEIHTRPSVVKDTHEALATSDRPFDFVLVCIKATPQSSSSVIEAIRPVIHPGLTSIVLIQNGLGVERAYREAFPDVSILSGVAYLPTTQLHPGVLAHSEMELLYLGLCPLSSSSVSHAQTQLKRFSQLLTRGGATVTLSDDIQAQRWSKVLANGALNPICALSRCRDRQLICVSALAKDLFRHVMLEIASVAAAAGYGHVTGPEAIDKQLARIVSRPMPGVEPSMMADARACRPMEVQAILGEIVSIAREEDIQVPRLEVLFVLLDGLNASLQGSLILD